MIGTNNDIRKIEKQMQEVSKDNTLYFDEYDMNGYPLFVSKKDEDLEYWVNDKNEIIKSDGHIEKKIGKLKTKQKRLSPDVKWFLSQYNINQEDVISIPGGFDSIKIPSTSQYNKIINKIFKDAKKEKLINVYMYSKHIDGNLVTMTDFSKKDKYFVLTFF